MMTWKKPGVHGKATLWCDGLISESRKRANKWAHGLNDSDDAPSKKRKTYEPEERVQELFEKLKSAHPTFTSMQLRIWAEMVHSGMYTSLDEPPNTSMFNRAGGNTAQSRNSNLLLLRRL
jgi:hypothetical protein